MTDPRLAVFPSNTPNCVCYACRNKIPVVDLEAVFHERLKHLFFSEAELAEYFSTADHVLKEKDELPKVLEAEHGNSLARWTSSMRSTWMTS